MAEDELFDISIAEEKSWKCEASPDFDAFAEKVLTCLVDIGLLARVGNEL